MGPESICTVRLGQLTMIRQAGAFFPASQAIGHWSAGMDPYRRFLSLMVNNLHMRAQHSSLSGKRLLAFAI